MKHEPFESWDDVPREVFFEIPQALLDEIAEEERLEREQQQKKE